MQVQLTPTLRSLALQSEVISIESLSRHLPNKPLLARLSGLANGVATFLSEKTEGLFNRPVQQQFNISGSPSNALKKTVYLDLKDVAMPCPEGLQVSYLEYAELLLECQKTTSYLLEDCLYPFSAFIGESLNYPDRLSSTIRTSGVKLHNLDTLRKKINAAFDGVNAELPYTKVIRRNAEWDDLEKALVRIVGTQKQTNDKLIAEKIQEIQANLELLISRMQDTNERYRPSAEVISELSRLAYGLAEQVTFYAIVATSIESLLVAVENGKNVIKAAVKK